MLGDGYYKVDFGAGPEFAEFIGYKGGGIWLRADGTKVEKEPKEIFHKNILYKTMVSPPTKHLPPLTA